MKKSNCLFAWIGLLAILFSTACSSNTNSNEPVVKTTHGNVKGVYKDTIYSFKGIPYGKAERFQSPEDPDQWNDTLICDNFGPVAKQIVPWIPDSTMDEKKLFSVNVWTQGIKDKKNRPVLVWLHGGGFFVGSSNDPMTYGDALAKKGDIVFVSVNHRLNILGFLDLSSVDKKYAHSANAGMLDIVKALEWVKNNITEFGGNPDDVTIVGESGGGGKVGTLMCMPSAKGLFHKAIIQSGTLVNTMNKEKSQALGSAVLEKLGIATNELEKLDTVDYFRLVKAGNDAVAQLAGGPRKPGSPTMFGFAPSADGVILLQQPFSPGFSDISKDIPVMIGSTLNEMMPVAYGEKNLTLEEAKKRLEEKYGEKTTDYLELFKTAYPDFTPQDLLSVDVVFRPYTIRTADARSKETTAPIYAYFLAWKSGVENASKGSFHGLDIPLAFYNVNLRPDWTGNTEEAWSISAKMSAAWINFVKTGNPNAEGLLPKWEPYTAENGNTMYFDNECRIVNNHDRALINFMHPLD